MLTNEFAIGNYISFKSSVFQVTQVCRRHLITLLESLNAEKDYKEETLYLAASLADRYLVNLAINGRTAPCLI